MGNDLSVPLEQVSKDEVVARVNSLGEKFQGYTAAIDENGIDGDVLAGMNEDEFIETLDDLGIDSRLHRRRLLQEFRKACEAMDGNTTVSSYSSNAEPLLPAQGPIEEVHVKEIECRPQDFPMPEEMEAGGVLRASHELPAFNEGLASEEEMGHLSEDFFAIDSVPGGYRPPIPADDMERVANQAKKSGKAAQAEIPASLAKKLPAPFKKLGSDTHVRFDQLAMDAEDLGDGEHALSQLSVLMQNCTSCHEAYRF